MSLGWLYSGRSFLADSLSSAAWLSSALRLHRGHEIQSHISYRSYNFILIVRSNFTMKAHHYRILFREMDNILISLLNKLGRFFTVAFRVLMLLGNILNSSIISFIL